MNVFQIGTLFFHELHFKHCWGKKIRNSATEWVPFTIVIGDNELNSNEFTVNIRKELLPVILHTYMSEKYRNNTLDFSDMDFQYLMLMAQHKELREMVHNRYLHLMQDESQDSSPGQFLTCLFTDRESFEDFIKKPMP